METLDIKNTLVVNLFAGPGVGKSTCAAGTFYTLKMRGVECELVREYAKDRSWTKDYFTLSNQVYVTGKQIHRQFMVAGQVDIIITDSPILTGLVYGGHGCTDGFPSWLKEVHDCYNNLNIFLERNLGEAPYNPNGRNQQLEEALQVDAELKQILVNMDVPFIPIMVQGEATVYRIIDEIAARLGWKTAVKGG